MCKVIEDMINEIINMRNIEVAVAMLKEKLSFSLVSEISGLPLVEVEKLAEMANA